MNEQDWTAYFNKLYEAYYNAVFEFCKIRLNGDEDASASCAHSVFDDARTKLDRLRRHPNLTGWFLTSARFAIARYNKRMAKSQAAYARFASAERSYYEHPIDDLISDETLIAARDEAIALLTEQERQLYKEFFIRKQSVESLAVEYGISVEAVRMRLCRLRGKLRRYVERIFM